MRWCDRALTCRTVGTQFSVPFSLSFPAGAWQGEDLPSCFILLIVLYPHHDLQLVSDKPTAMLCYPWHLCLLSKGAEGLASGPSLCSWILGGFLCDVRCSVLGLGDHRAMVPLWDITTKTEELAYIICPHLLSVQKIMGLGIVTEYSLFLELSSGPWVNGLKRWELLQGSRNNS